MHQATQSRVSSEASRNPPQSADRPRQPKRIMRIPLREEYIGEPRPLGPHQYSPHVPPSYTSSLRRTAPEVNRRIFPNETDDAIHPIDGRRPRHFAIRSRDSSSQMVPTMRWRANISRP
jgi:hypothetical protein